MLSLILVFSQVTKLQLILPDVSQMRSDLHLNHQSSVLGSGSLWNCFRYLLFSYRRKLRLRFRPPVFLYSMQLISPDFLSEKFYSIQLISPDFLSGNFCFIQLKTRDFLSGNVYSMQLKPHNLLSGNFYFMQLKPHGFLPGNFCSRKLKSVGYKYIN
jgi:hypothetical protein